MFYQGGGSLAPKEDIVRSRCAGGEATLPAFGKKKNLMLFGSFVIF